MVMAKLQFSSSAHPGEVTNIAVEVEQDTIIISWDAAESNGNDITNYHVVILNTITEIVQHIKTVDGSVLRLEVDRSELQKNVATLYTVRITAENGVGIGPPSKGVQFTLPTGKSMNSVCACVCKEEKNMVLSVLSLYEIYYYRRCD